MPQITQLDNDPTPNNNDLLVTVDMAAGTTKNISREQFFTGAPLPANTVDSQAISDSAVTTGKINNGSVTPVKRSGGFKVGTIPAATFATTGNKSVTGIGFRPKYIEFEVIFDPSSNSMRTGRGWMDEFGSQGFSATASNNALLSGTSLAASRCIGWINVGNAARAMGASYVSMNADGFTINVNEANNAFPIVYKAFA